MDPEDEATTYLKFLNDGSQNYLLHNTEEGLTDAFPVDSIFTEISSNWASDGFPILLSGPLISDNNEESLGSNLNLFAEDNESSTLNEDSSSNTVTFFSNIPDKNVRPNNLILSNDVLLELKSDAEQILAAEAQTIPNNQFTHIINGDTYAITYGTEENGNANVAVEEAEEEGDVNKTGQTEELIQLLNIDGTVTTINKNLLTVVETKSKIEQNGVESIEEFFTDVTAKKCKICGFLCEGVEEIKVHLSSQHSKTVNEKNDKVSLLNVANDNNYPEIKMTSILNINQEKKFVMFVCSECNDGYLNKEDLRQHMIAQHNLVYVTKPEDAAAPNRKSDKAKDNEKSNSVRNTSVSLLKKQQRAMKKIKCSIKGCPFRFAKDDLRKRHEDCHVNQEKNQFQCPACKEKFSIWRICNMHMWKCHSIDLGLLTCPLCNEFKSNSSVKVINHMAIHNEERPYICTSCGKSFKQANQLRNHEIMHRAPENVPDWFSIKQCEFCERYFSNTKCLKKHIKSVHDKFKPFICNICGYQAARKAMLQLHYRQHTGDKPHHCSYCDYKTRDHNCLRKHTMRHFGAAKYSCPYCNYQSIQSSAYKMHLTNKHPGKEGTYACTVCTYTTINVASYLSHVKCHELDKKLKRTAGKSDKASEEKQNEDSSLISSTSNKVEDDETQHCFLNNEHSEEAVDTGGITIPAGFDLQLVS